MSKEKNTNKCSVSFNINEQEYFVIEIPHKSIDQLQSCEQLTGMYHTRDGRILPILNQYSCIEGELDDLIEKLTCALDNKLEIDKAKFPNIGYQWNEDLYFASKGENFWPGAEYLCFSTANNIETFIYTENSIIYLEIIPTYPWLFGRAPKDLKKVSFKQFLKDYKPYARTTITRETAEKWLVTAQNLRDIIDRNAQN